MMLEQSIADVAPRRLRRKSFRVGAVLLTVLSVGAVAADTPTRAPEFTHRERGEWINSAPLKLSSLRGSVVLIEFWAFDCVLEEASSRDAQ